MLLSHESLLSEVNDVFNGILVRGDAIGDVMFYGRGAGKLPTASAVVADVIDEVKHLGARKYLFWEHGEEKYVEDHQKMESAVFVRLCGDNAATVQKELEPVLGKCTIITVEESPSNEVAFVTPVLPKQVIEQAISALTNVTVLSQIPVANF
jgi:homoserine dehydrogenase